MDSEITGLVNRDRLAEDLYNLVNIPSPTGREGEAAFTYAAMLSAAGAEVEMDDTYPDSPIVIGRLQGQSPGKTFQFAGHIDHIDLPHEEPSRDEEFVSGRGAADMKNGLAGILEIIRVLNESGRNFSGEILVTVYGMHEAPEGDSRCLRRLIQNGVLGGSALVMEGPFGQAVVQGKGLAIWTLSLSREDIAQHELGRPMAADSLLAGLTNTLSMLRGKQASLERSAAIYPLLGTGSLFTGQIHYGDFYSRVPADCFIQGTRRWTPDQSYEQVTAEFGKWLAGAQCPTNITTGLRWDFVADAFSVAEDQPIVDSLRQAFHMVTGRDVIVKGNARVSDANLLVMEGNVPALLCGFGCGTAHADKEIVNIDDMVPAAQVALLTALNFLVDASEEMEPSLEPIEEEPPADNETGDGGQTDADNDLQEPTII